MGFSSWEQVLTILIFVFFELVKGRALDSVNPTTLSSVIWPTVESGLLLLRPASCTPELRNCSGHGACALHGKQPRCLCVIGYHGNFCEIKTSAVPPLHVATVLLSILAVYIIIHAGCVIHRSQCQRSRSRSCDLSRKRPELGSYGSIGEQTIVFESTKKPSYQKDETQTTT